MRAILFVFGVALPAAWMFGLGYPAWHLEGLHANEAQRAAMKLMTGKPFLANSVLFWMGWSALICIVGSRPERLVGWLKRLGLIAGATAGVAYAALLLFIHRDVSHAQAIALAASCAALPYAVTASPLWPDNRDGILSGLRMCCLVLGSPILALSCTVGPMGPFVVTAFAGIVFGPFTFAACCAGSLGAARSSRREARRAGAV